MINQLTNLQTTVLRSYLVLIRFKVARYGSLKKWKFTI